MNDTLGTILHLQRLSTEDGPGIRTTVFLKGCPLRCAWCHNPESISPKPQVQWLENRCIGCRTCLNTCPHGALQPGPQGPVRDLILCIACGACVEACPANAHELLGHHFRVSELVKELIKDRIYFEKSGGGVTVSGGEPTLQPDFAAGLLAALRAAGVSTALDTCGLCKVEVLERLVDDCDMILFDLKLLDSDEHRKHTGAGNARILDNLQWLGRFLEENPGKRLWVRTPLIPGATFSQDNLNSVGAWLASHLPEQVERWELCAFNNLCRDKYRRLGQHWAYAGIPLLSEVELANARNWAASSGFNPQRVFVTGASQMQS